MDSTLKEFLRTTASSLSRFLDEHLPEIGGSGWWQTHVLNLLSHGQRGQVHTKNISRIGALDLAALIRVFDRNWSELSYRCRLADELKTHIKELANIRNAISHEAAEQVAIAPEDALRYLDTMLRVLRSIGGDAETLAAIEVARMTVMRTMVGDVTPAPEVITIEKEVIREVPVEVIKEVLVEVDREIKTRKPPADEQEPTGGIVIGSFRLVAADAGVAGMVSGFDGTKSAARLFSWKVYGRGLRFTVQVAVLNEGTAKEVGQVECTSRENSPEVWDDIVHRLRIGIRDQGQGQWIMDLRAVERAGAERAARRVWSMNEYMERKGINLQSSLKQAGGIAVDTRATLVNDQGRNRNIPAVLFNAGDFEVAAAGWVIATLEPLAEVLEKS